MCFLHSSLGASPRPTTFFASWLLNQSEPLPGPELTTARGVDSSQPTNARICQIAGAGWLSNIPRARVGLVPCEGVLECV